MSTNIESPGQGKRGEESIPLRIKLKVRDLADPITVSRFGMVKVAAAFFVVAILAVFVWMQFFQPPSGPQLVSQMVESAGGMEAWSNIESGSFKRTHNVYDENGELVNTTDETFYFKKVDGQLQLLVEHVRSNGDKVVIGKSDEGYWATVNGEETGAEEKARELGMMCESEFCSPLCSTEMAFYRFSFPFKLTDPGVNPKTAGTTLLGGEEMLVLDVTYEEGIGSDKWVFYVKTEDKTIRKIEHFANAEEATNPEEIYVSNFKKEAGINFGHKRTYYRSNGKILEEYVFSEANFNSDLPDEFFASNQRTE